MPEQPQNSELPLFFMSPQSVQKDGTSVAITALCAAVVRKWHYFVVSVMICSLLGILVCSLLAKRYTASMVVGPIATQGYGVTGGTGPLSSVIRTVLSDIGDEENRKYDAFIAMLTSSVAARKISEDSALMAALFANEWDAKKSQWSSSGSTLSLIKNTAKSWIGYPAWSPPDTARLLLLMKRDMRIRKLLVPGYYEVSFEARDGETAEAFLRGLYRVADSTLKTRAQASLDARISRTKKELGSSKNTNNEDLLALLRMQETKRLEISDDLPYAGSLMSPPETGRNPTSPNFAAILIGFPLLGLLFAAIAVAWSYRRRPEGERA